MSVLIEPKRKKDVSLILTDAWLPAGSTTALSDCLLLNLSNALHLSLTIRATYHSSSTAGITVYLYSSTDGSIWDTDELTSFEPSFTAGTTVQKTVLVDPDVKYLKVKVTNKQADQGVADVTVKATVTK